MEEKKNSKYDINRYRGMFFNAGLVLSLAAVLMAFEWKTPNAVAAVDLPDKPDEWVTILEPPPTVIPPPPKPKIENFVLIEKPDEEEIENELEDLDIMIDQTTVIEEVEFVEQTETEVVDEVLIRAETMPKFNGGSEIEFLKYVSERLRYPNMARRIGLEGKVFAQFVVDKDGSMTEIKIIRGIGAGCDEEVLRVIKNAPKWEPGKQRGRPVKVRMVIPVKFDLN